MIRLPLPVPLSVPLPALPALRAPLQRLLHPIAQLAPRLSLALVCVVLAGCATAPGGSTAPGSATAPSDRTVANESTSTASTPLFTRRSPPLVPGGALQPIQASEAASVSVVALQAPADLWERIRRGYRMPDLAGDLVTDREQWYANRPDYIQRMTERSSKYLFYIVEELERRNMPTELALLPFIESAFNPQAVSSAKAAGMWQFMPATGKDFDLKQNAFRDDRRDVLASTRAALDYLQMLHGMFNDWHLALAAYNWGQGSVKRSVERNQRRGLPTGYTDLSMPAETRLYVPKLQAVKNIVARPADFGARLPNIGNHPFFDTVTIDRDIDVSLAAKLAEVDEADFKALNPSMHRPVILAAGSSEILLPWDNAGVFKRNLQYHIGPLASWTAWAVPTHMRTADIAKRVGMPESDLRSLNQIPPSMLVRAGSTLLVPRDSNHKAEVPENLADNGHVQLQPEVVRRKSTVKARKGETVATLARRLRLDASDVAQWNKLSTGQRLKTGQAMVVFRDVVARTGASRSVRSSSKASKRVVAQAKSSRSSKASSKKSSRKKK